MRTLLQLLLNAVRTCCGALASFGHIAAWIVLSATLLLMVVIYSKREISVPNFLIRRIESELATAQLSARFGATSFDPTGNVVLENITVHAKNLSEPIITCRAAHIKISPWALLIGQLEVYEIRLVETQLNCPAIVSPTGASQPLIRNLHLLATRSQNTWSVHAIDLHIANLFATGRASWTPTKLPRSRSTTTDFLPAYLQYTRRASREIPLLKNLEAPVLKFDLNHDASGAVDFRATLNTPKIEWPALGSAIDAQIAIAATQEPERKIEAQVALAAGEVTAAAGTAKNIHARLTTSLDPESFAATNSTLVVSTGALRYEKFDVSLPHASAAIAVSDDFSALETELCLDFASAKAAINLAQKNATVHFDADLSAKKINEILGRVVEATNSITIASMRFDDPLAAKGTAVFSDDWKFQNLDARLEAGRFDVYGVSVTDVSGRLSLSGKNLAATDIVMRSNGSIARGSYTMDTQTLDHRFLLTGEIFPSDISPWFTSWWDVFWSDFDFKENRPSANLDIHGRWRSPQFSTVMGRITTGEMAMCDVPFDRVSLRLFTRPNFFDIKSFDAVRGATRTTGRFSRKDYPLVGEPQWLQFDVRSNLSLAENIALIGHGEDIIKPFAFENPPEIDARGRIDWDPARKTTNDIFATVLSTGTMRYSGFPIENLHTEIVLKSNDITLRKIDAVLSTGLLTGQATITGPEDNRFLRFNASLENADFPRLMKTWSDYRAGHQPPASTAAPQTKPSASPITKGRINLTLAAEGPAGSTQTLVGKGTASVTESDLATIKLLGPLSSLLKGTPLSFTTLDLSDATAEFTLDRELLRFSSLRLGGPSALLKGKGTYNIENSAVDFRVTLHPFRKNESAVATIIGVVLDPLASVLEVKLTGSIEKPSWSFVAGPTNILRTLGGADKKQDTAPETTPQPVAPAP